MSRFELACFVGIIVCAVLISAAPFVAIVGRMFR
jgi:hypothetical protein